ncbi:DUF2793 domain-containing protein [Sulfitobacter sp. 1A13421]|uniref:DUF2793 domain-containing protein n=1 Tax=Sulfitobacter sp. 1A13421 TaxID=3368595 RepID=UPI0037453C59
MPDTSERLSLPYLMPAQAQKHVTHNEALQRLDLLVQLAIEGFEANTPPALPQAGEVHALGDAPTEAWAGHPGELAAWVEETWQFTAPQDGWVALDKSTGILHRWGAGAWTEVSPPDLANLSGLGVNTDHDSGNRLSVSSPASLFTHEGAGHQLKLNKASAADTASLLFQTDWSGRAEMGTAGQDDFAIKVSADGSSWTTALAFDAASGIASGAALTQDVGDATVGRLLRVGDFGIGADAGPLVTDLDAHDLSGSFSSHGGAHAQATVGANPFPALNGVFGLLCGNSTLGGQSAYLWQIALGIDTPGLAFRVRATGAWGAWQRIWSGANTTVDANGFIKEASPIVRLFRDGSEEPAVPLGAGFERVGLGHYRLSNVPPLASRGWQIEAPQDANGNRLVHVACSYDAGTLDIRTREVIWQDGWAGGAPRDIPDGRWVDLRFDMR